MHTPSRFVVKITPLAAAGLGVALLGACGGGGSSSPSCDAVTPDAVRAALGVEVGPPVPSGADGTAVCTFTSTGGTPRTIIVRVQRGVDAQAFQATKDSFTSTGQQAETVSGFYDDAFSSVLTAQKISTTTLVARRGTDEVLVTSPATLAQERALVASVFDALG